MQRLGLEVGAVLLGAEGHRLQGILHAHGLSYLVGIHHEGCLSEVVQVEGVNCHTVLHAIVHGGNTAADTHVVNLLRIQVVVVHIALGNLHLNVVFALQAEHGIAEGVLCRRRVVRVLVGKCYLHLVALQVGGVIVLVAEIVEGIVVQLLVGQFHRAAVDAVVDGIIRCRGLVDGIAVYIFITAHVGGVLRVHAVGQVDDVVCLSVLEECGIAGAIHLLHLPAYGRQQQFILAGHGVRCHVNALALRLHLGLVTAAASMLIDGVALGDFRMLHVAHQPRLGVALQG